MMRHLRQWTPRLRRAVRAAVVAVDPGEDQEPVPTDGPSSRGSRPDADLCPELDEEQEQEFLDGLEEELRRDFARACFDLASQRRRQRPRDLTRLHGAVDDGRTGVDLVLDMYLLHREIQAGRLGRGQTVDRSCPAARVSHDAA